MKIRIICLLFYFALTSCEFIQNEEIQPAEVIEKEAAPAGQNKDLNKNKPTPEITDKALTQISQFGQNPNKSFDDIGSNVTRGKAKHPFPRKNLLK